MSDKLKKVDSAVQGLSSTTPKDAENKSHKKTASTGGDVKNIDKLEGEGTEIQVAEESQRTGWKINTSPSTVVDKDILKKMLTKPPVKKVDLHFPLGLKVTARNLKGVTIKDAMNAIYDKYKNRPDDELDNPYLAGFEWDREKWTQLTVHLQKDSGAVVSKKKKKNED